MILDLIMQTPADSAAAVIGGAVGAAVTAKVALGIGVVTKALTDLVLKIKDLENKLPSAVKPFIALGVTALLTFGNAELAKIGAPAVAGVMSIGTLVAWGVSMGFHSAVKAIFKTK